MVSGKTLVVSRPKPAIIPAVAVFRRSQTVQRSLVLAAVLMASYAYFYEGGGWNQNTRFDLVRALTERQTVQIDLYESNTGDKAHFEGHFYTDKAPGASLTAVPAVAVARAALGVARRDLYAADTIAWLSYVATVMAASVPAALAALCIFWISLRLGAGTNAACIAALVCGLGTPLWAYATLLYGHALAAGCLAAAVFGVVCLRDAGRRASDATIGFWTGAAAGWAVVTEFPAAVPSALIVAWACWQAREWERRRLRRLVMALGAGSAVAATVLFVYNWIAFGSLFYIAYSSEAGAFEEMKTGIFGVNLPQADIAYQLLFGRYRGLLPLAPVLALAPVGLWMWIRRSATRDVALMSAAIAAFYFLLAAGYSYWDGGWSYASRHLGPALPFLALGIAPLWQHSGRFLRMCVLVLAIAGAGQSLVAVATTPQPPGGDNAPRDPMRELLWPMFVAGEFPIGWQSVLERDAPSEPMSELVRRGVPRASWNLGQKLGLRGHASLLPLVAIWIGAFVAWRRVDARAPALGEADDGI
jgi:hypothetical protein